jgi:hypothetical protein
VLLYKNPVLVEVEHSSKIAEVSVSLRRPRFHFKIVRTTQGAIGWRQIYLNATVGARSLRIPAYLHRI